jgi:hypothetical protein
MIKVTSPELVIGAMEKNQRMGNPANHVAPLAQGHPQREYEGHHEHRCCEPKQTG